MCRTPFFFASLERDDDGMRVAEDAMDGRQGLEPGESIDVAESCVSHRSIVARFAGEKQEHLPGNNHAQASFIGNFYPLQDAKSPFS